MGFRLDTMVRLGQSVLSLSVWPGGADEFISSFVHVQCEFGISIADETS